jgi:conjugal transfer mating pair stabilization protein TraN
VNGARLLAAASALLACGQLAQAQMAAGDARSEGEAIARGVRDSTNAAILGNSSPATVPGFEGTDFPQHDYVDDPVDLTAAGEAQRYQDNYRVVVDPYRTIVDPTTIDLSRAQTIAADPETYLGSAAPGGGTNGTCNPLPPGGGGSITYLESCNLGSQPYDEARSCTAPLIIQTQGSRYWEYTCETGGLSQGQEMCPDLARIPAASSCSLIRSERIGETCLQWVEEWNGRRWCADPGEPIYRQYWHCPDPLPGMHGREVNTTRIVSETVEEASCQTVRGDSTCSLSSEVCTRPNETRTIGGLSVTRPCWEWSRAYQCSGLSPANDCSTLEARPECSFSHDECLSHDADGITCNVYDRWFQCTTPDTGSAPPPAYVCAGDLYCMAGECTRVEREASTEFKDAMVAMNIMGELRDGFDPDKLRIFSGENLKCTKKVFGLSNCCSGKGVPLLTPFLCSREDRDVDKRDDAGLCNYIGTYCSDKVLGVCVTRKQSYCCYGSKLVRILNDEGKAQLGMQWGKPKNPDCEGFLIAQFQQLDLSRMDFREVYAEFVDAAKLPDEVEMSIQIQRKIEAYYDTHGGT